MHSSRIPIRPEGLIWIAAGLLALAFGVAGCGSGERGETPSPPPAEGLSSEESMPEQPAAAERADREEDEEADELAAAAQALKNSDPDERSAALFGIEPVGGGLQLLLEVLSDDPDPEVRGLAARQLGYAESPEATAGLVSALDDPDPEVLIEVIDVLGLTGDSTVIESLEGVLQHPDARVREAAEEAVEFLSD